MLSLSFSLSPLASHYILSLLKCPEKATFIFARAPPLWLPGKILAKSVNERENRRSLTFFLLSPPPLSLLQTRSALPSFFFYIPR